MAVMLAVSIAALLAHAKPGDTVVLPAGDYGPETIAGLSFVPAVTLDARALKSTNITFQDVTGLHVQGGTWANAMGETFAGHTWAVAVKCQRCHDVTFDAATFVGPPRDAPGREFAGYGLSFEDSDHVAATHSTFTGFRMGLGFAKTGDFVATDNDFGFMTSDGIDVGQGWRGRIEDNVFHDTHITGKEHADGIQLWSRLDTPPTSDILIRHNKVSGDTQGISAFNEPGGYDRITIEDNDVAITYTDAISLVGARDSVIRNNHVSTLENPRYRAIFVIRPDEGEVKHCGNVAEPAGGKPGWDDGRCPKK